MCCIRHTRPGRLERHARIRFHRARSQWSKTSSFNAFLFHTTRVPNSQARPNPASHHGRLLSVSFLAGRFLFTRVKFFSRVFVSVCLSSFACMFLNNVAIMYKSLALYASKYYPVLSLLFMCSSQFPQDLRSPLRSTRFALIVHSRMLILRNFALSRLSLGTASRLYCLNQLA